MAQLNIVPSDGVTGCSSEIITRLMGPSHSTLKSILPEEFTNDQNNQPKDNYVGTSNLLRALPQEDTSLAHLSIGRITHMKHPILHLVVTAFLAAEVVPIVARAQTAPPISGVKGKLEAANHDSISIQTQSGIVRVAIEQPLTTYRQTPSDLSHVTSSSYVGVASARQSDGSEIATQIKIFPPELRGAGEGSSMMDAAPGAMTHSRMTNGSVSRPVSAMSHSRMTNGTVQKGNGTTLVLHYQNGSETISVPAGVPVTQVVPGKVTLVPGDTVYAATTKQPNGTLTTNKIFLIAGVPTTNTM
jgi:hypothetical protein